MSMFQRLWNSQSEPAASGGSMQIQISTTSTNSNHHSLTTGNKRIQKERRLHEVEMIKDDQALNPYTEIQILQKHTDIVRHLLQIDDERCVSAGDDGIATVWDLRFGRRICVLQGHTRPITCMLVMERAIGYYDDPYLLTAASDKTMKVWDIEKGECLQTLTEHQTSVKSLVLMWDGELVCSAGENICVWDRKGRLLCTQEQLQLCNTDIHLMISIKHDKLVAASEKQLFVYALTDEMDENQPNRRCNISFTKKLPPHRELIRCLINVSDTLFASGSLDGTVVLWTTHTISPTRYFNTVNEYKGIEKTYPFSIQHMLITDEKYMFAAVGTGFCVYDVIAGKLLAEKLCAHYSKITYAEFLYNGTFLATCSEDGSIRLWGSRARFESRVDDNTDEIAPIERFLGVSKEKLRIMSTDEPLLEPDLLGECLAHSGAVHKLVDFGAEGFVSCGMDSLVISWKDGVLQSLKRTEIAREMVLGVGDA
ncbi:WD repeat-containing protein 41-like [Tubulanus polymorphus]|uniref:WD repeat-containing protein 41-like n=1 Tax=Tubulanus polymorphus TaxID=672921 RepID=UPI003DA4A309